MSDNVVGLPQAQGVDSIGATGFTRVAPPGKHSICDKPFMEDVEQLKALRSYLIRQAKSTAARTIELGDLNLLRFDQAGRFPTSEEWSDLEHRSNELYQHLTEPDRRRFLHGQIPDFVITTAEVLGLIALGALVVAFTGSLIANALTHLELVNFGNKILAAIQGTLGLTEFVEASYRLLVFVTFLGWVAALGAIGSISFIGMNALAVQDDATFDITNKKLIVLRVVLGALFAVVLTLPFGLKAFTDFLSGLYLENPAETTSGLASKSILLLLPFFLGFSTTLVIMILNQYVEAVQMFFGKRSSPPPAAAEGKSMREGP
jgi:hypothetical protein